MFHRRCLIMLVVIAYTLISLQVLAQTMPHGWSQSFGDVSNQYAMSVTVDGSGNSIVTGLFVGTVDFGGGTLTSAGGEDIFLAKFDAAGTCVWSQRFGDSSGQVGYSVAVDGTGDIIVTGGFDGTVDFGGGTLTSLGADIFLAKFDASGAHVWSKRFGDATAQRGLGLAVDSSGNIVMAGYIQGTVNFGGGALTSAGSYDIFLAKFDAAGTHLWSKHFGDNNDQSEISVAMDGSGNSIITGSFASTVNFGGGTLTSAGQRDIFLAKFDASGAHLWSKRFGDGNAQGGESVAVDGSENIILTGYVFGTVDFGGGTLTSVGSSDIFIAKFDASGAHLWSQRFGDGNDQLSQSVAVDTSGNIVVTGYFVGTVNFGGGALTSAGGWDIFLSKCDPSGAHLWSQRFGEASHQLGKSVSTDRSGNIVVTGDFGTTVNFGGATLTSAGSYDIFLAKFYRASPDVFTIRDIPNDQGRQVRISWLGSAWDYVGSPTPITEYAIYRKIDYALASPPAPAPADRLDPIRAYPPGDWDYLVTVPADAEDDYSTVVPTLEDSTIVSGIYYTTFFIRARTNTPGMYYDSLPDSGYSVDNLAPGVPGGFAVAYNTGSGNQLSWDESPEGDFRYYCIYRGNTPDFTPDENNKVDMVTTAQWTDPDYDGWNVYYKITAVDFSGNESASASLGDVTGATDTSTPKHVALHQNVPNPFNPYTTISFDLREEADVSLVVYDLSGRLVRVLASGKFKAQRYDAVWDGMDAHGLPVASGVYFYRLKAGNDVLTRKAVLLK